MQAIKVRAIQTDASAAVAAIGEISEVINHISTGRNTITAAVALDAPS
ncbi:hypothetical protein GCM10022223_54900 [Kineosporia mesophila]|uniref:Uncharacterized protein n=1 Tax=Kineosporia mesophila TaxID=566012 RepID=A0ABP7ADY0_9ACTN|nr:hypothetical protein [Kineosporia mesophila]MCD5352795.1 hypothetical protein [Kineosporia mesophila]